MDDLESGADSQHMPRQVCSLCKGPAVMSTPRFHSPLARTTARISTMSSVLACSNLRIPEVDTFVPSLEDPVSCATSRNVSYGLFPHLRKSWTVFAANIENSYKFMDCGLVFGLTHPFRPRMAQSTAKCFPRGVPVVSTTS